MKVTTTGSSPSSAARVTVRPSWSRSAKSGSAVPGGRIAPSQPADAVAGSSPRWASHTPPTAAAAQRLSVISAMNTRGGSTR